MFKVFAGSFKSRENAQERIGFLRSKGIQSFIVATIISGETWFRGAGWLPSPFGKMQNNG